MPTLSSFALRRIAFPLWVSIATIHTQAQPLVAPAANAEPHEALAFFEGSWTTSTSTPEDDFRETCSWLPGARRHMVCRSSWMSGGERREGLSVFSYDASSNEYRYHGFRSGGAVVFQTGQRIAGGWSFTADRGTGDDRVRSRVTMRRVADDRFSFLSESAKGDKPWTVAAQFDYVRVPR